MASKSVKKKVEKTLDATESLIKKSKDKAKDERKITSQSKKLTEKQGKGVSVVEGEGVKTIKNFGKAKKGGENIRSRRKSETKTDTKADTKSKKNLPAKLKNIEKTLGRKLTKKEIAGLTSAGLLPAGISMLGTIKPKEKTTEGKKKPTTTRGKSRVEGKKRRVGKFAPGFRPFKGKLAKILLGEDEQFGGGKGGLLDPNLGLGVRRGGRSVATTITTKDKDGNVISKHTEKKRLNPEVSAKKDRKDVPEKNMGGMMKAKGKAKGGPIRRKMSKGGSLRKMSDGGDVLSKSKVVKLSKVAKALIEKGLRKVKAEKKFTGKQIQEARREINRMTGVSSTKTPKTPKEKMLSAADFRATEKSQIPTANQRKEKSRRRNEARLAEGKADGGIMKAKGGPVRRKMSKGGTLKKVGADQKGLKKLPTSVRNKMGYMKDGGMPKKKGYAKGGPVKPRKMSKGGMTKPRKMSKGGMTKPRKMSKGGTARRGSPRGVGAAKRGFGKALRGK